MSTQKDQDNKFLRMAIALAREGMEGGNGGPFGAIVVKQGEVIGRGFNRVLSGNDPTAHAEITAIRDACRKLDSFQLDGCTLYTSCEPCPMCLGAIYWARPERMVYACSRHDAASVGFDDHFIYEEISLPPEKRQLDSEQLLNEEALEIMKLWQTKADKVNY